MDSPLTTRYETEIRRLITDRLRVVMLAGTFLYLAFVGLDALTYPQHLLLFLKIRLAVSAALLTTFFLCRLSFIRNRVSGAVHVIMAIAALGICLMIYYSDGSTSDYYEGLNLVLLAFLITNGFQSVHNLIFGVIVLLMYTAVVMARDSIANIPNYSNACFFMGATAFFCTLLSSLYSAQHKKQFIATERLMESEMKLANAYQVVKTQSETDELTKVYNRRAFIQRLEEKIQGARERKVNFWLVLLDIDHFKQINDTYGHEAGDQAIQTLVGSIEKMLRQDGYIGRYGGDEFMFVLDAASHGQIWQRLDNIRAVTNHLSIRRGECVIPLSATYGAVEFLYTDPPDVHVLIRLADEAMLEAKKTQRGSAHIFQRPE